MLEYTLRRPETDSTALLLSLYQAIPVTLNLTQELTKNHFRYSQVKKKRTMREKIKHSALFSEVENTPKRLP